MPLLPPTLTSATGFCGSSLWRLDPEPLPVNIRWGFTDGGRHVRYTRIGRSLKGSIFNLPKL